MQKVLKLIGKIVSGMGAKLEKIFNMKSHLPGAKTLEKCLGFMLHPTITLSLILATCFLISSGVVLGGEKTGKVGEFECLNEGLVCRTEPTEDHYLSEYFPEEVEYTAKVSVADNSQLMEKLGYLFWSYWIEGEVTEKKMRLMEYHFLIRLTLLKWVIPVDILTNYLNEEEIVQYGAKVSRGWFLSREMKVPDYPKVKSIHQLFLQATEPAGPYMHRKSDVYPNTITTYRSLSAVGPGGFPGSGYNSSYTQRRIAEAKYKLYKLLEEIGVKPH